MKRILTVVLLLGLGLSGDGYSQKEGLLWHDSMEEAQLQAERDGRPILVFVTFSGHREEDMRLRSEVFADPEFVRFSRQHLVLMEVDFSPSGVSSDEMRQAHRRLARNLKVTTFPSLVLIDGKAGKTSRIDHADQTAASLVREVQRVYTGG